MDIDYARAHGLLPHLKAYAAARLRVDLWGQGAYWVPQKAWDGFVEASIITRTMSEVIAMGVDGPVTRDPIRDTLIIPNYRVAGILHIEDMAKDYKEAVLDFIRQQAQGVCGNMIFESVFMPSGGGDLPDMLMDELEREQALWMRRAQNEIERDYWLSGLPIVKALKA